MDLIRFHPHPYHCRLIPPPIPMPPADPNRLLGSPLPRPARVTDAHRQDEDGSIPTLRRRRSSTARVEIVSEASTASPCLQALPAGTGLAQILVDRGLDPRQFAQL
jgi:hypothetical protein